MKTYIIRIRDCDGTLVHDVEQEAENLAHALCLWNARILLSEAIALFTLDECNIEIWEDKQAAESK